ncbi:ornithine cyclodeaminase family protein [Georgenia yuyongxinii]
MGATLVIPMQQVKDLLSVEECVRLQEEVFGLSASGRAWEGASAWARPEVAAMAHPRSAKMMLGGIEPDWWGIKMIAFSDGDVDAKRRMAIVTLFEAESLLPAAIIEANYLGYMRTGAAGAVATRHLARPDARVIGVLGSGAVSRFSVDAHLALGRDVDKICLFSPSAERAARFAADIRQRHGVDVETFGTADDVARRAEILITGTGAGTPAFDPTVLAPGTHVSAMGHQGELDPRIFSMARTIADEKANAVAHGKLSTAIAAGAADAEVVAASLGDVIAGARPGRRSESEITLFDSSGLTFQDIAVGVYLRERVLERELQQMVEIDTDKAMW